MLALSRKVQFQVMTCSVILMYIKAETRIDMHLPLFIATVFIIVNMHKLPKCSPIDGCMDKRLSVHTVGYYSGFREKLRGGGRERRLMTV